MFKMTVKTPEKKTKSSCERFSKKKTDYSRNPSSLASNIFYLQRTIGNKAVQNLIESEHGQAKFRISQPGDEYEREADRVASAVMRMPEPQVQRQVEQEDLKKQEFTHLKPLSRKTSWIDNILPTKIQSIIGDGKPLPDSVRYFFEPRFGYDFNNVRIHSGSQAAESARIINAKAYTFGQNIVFGRGQYSLGTKTGMKVLAHELSHVVQQTSIDKLYRAQGKKDTPELEDCREDMKQIIPQSHQKAIELTHKAIEYYKEIFNIVNKSNNFSEIYKSIGKKRSNYLAVYWRIYVEPKIRKHYGLLTTSSKSYISLEILYPLSQIISVYEKIYKGLLKSDFNYECEYKDYIWFAINCKGTDAYVWKVGGDIHICVDELTDPKDIIGLAKTIVHEASHKFANTEDDIKNPYQNAHNYGNNLDLVL